MVSRGQFVFSVSLVLGLLLGAVSLEARKVGISHRLPEIKQVTNEFFKQTHLSVRAYKLSSSSKKSRLLEYSILLNPCDSNEVIDFRGYEGNPEFSLSLSDFSCDIDYRISFYAKIANQSAVKISGLEAVRTRSLNADEAGNIIFEFIQTPVAVKPWHNRSKNQISLSPNPKT